jgi:DNA repair protein RadA/Sms
MALFKCALQKRFDDDGNPLCTYETNKAWKGRCPQCHRLSGWVKVGADAKPATARVTAAMSTTDAANVERISTGNEGLNYVLGGGLVKGQTVLFGGPQGQGKSRLMMQICQSMTETVKGPLLYASAEETATDVVVMCRGVGATSDRIEIIGSDTFDIYSVLERCEKIKPALLVLDSLQAADGWGAQNTPTAILIKEHCDRTGMCAFIMNHMTAELNFRGGTTVTHMVKTMLMLYEYDPEQDGGVAKTFGNRFKARVDRGEVDLVGVKTLMSGKNRSGGSGRKAFYMFTETGVLAPLKTRSPIQLPNEDEEDDAA